MEELSKKNGSGVGSAVLLVKREVSKAAEHGPQQPDPPPGCHQVLRDTFSTRINSFTLLK